MTLTGDTIGDSDTIQFTNTQSPPIAGLHLKYPEKRNERECKLESVTFTRADLDERATDIYRKIISHDRVRDEVLVEDQSEFDWLGWVEYDCHESQWKAVDALISPEMKTEPLRSKKQTKSKILFTPHPKAPELCHREDLHIPSMSV